MRFKFRGSPWLSAGLLTLGVTSVGVTGCNQASQEARPPDNLGALIKKAPDETSRSRTTGGGSSQSYAPAATNSGSRMASSGSGVSNPISSLRRPPTGVRPMGSSQPASRGGTKSKKGL